MERLFAHDSTHFTRVAPSHTCREDIAPLNSGIPTSSGLVLADSSHISLHPVVPPLNDWEITAPSIFLHPAVSQTDAAERCAKAPRAVQACLSQPPPHCQDRGT